MAQKLTAEQRKGALGELSNWTWDEENQAIDRGFEFKDFSAAFAFMTAVALAAEKADHHPDWMNSWNRVDIQLTTHSAGGLTELDLKLAKRIDEIAARHLA